MNAKFLILHQKILGNKTKIFFFLGMSLPWEFFLLLFFKTQINDRKDSVKFSVLMQQLQQKNTWLLKIRNLQLLKVFILVHLNIILSVFP